MTRGQGYCGTGSCVLEEVHQGQGYWATLFLDHAFLFSPAEAKLSGFWQLVLDEKKQIFTAEKFLSLASEEGKCKIFRRLLFSFGSPRAKVVFLTDVCFALAVLWGLLNVSWIMRLFVSSLEQRCAQCCSLQRDCCWTILTGSLITKHSTYNCMQAALLAA